MRLVRAIAALALLASSVLAQTSIHSALSGRVLDPSGASVSGVQIALTNRATNQRMDAASGEDRLFTFGRLLPGNYSLTAEKTGFQRLQREGLQIAVNQVATLMLNMSVGEVTTTVNVQGDASPIQTQNADVSLLIDNTRLRDLPLNGKDFQKLMFLAPGVGSFRSNNPNSNASVSGTREAGNNYVIDGVSSNDERETAGLALGASFRQQPNVISTEALQEFRIITSNADATFGRGSGAQVNIVTRSGTNEFHGSAYEYLRNSALDARDFFNYGPYLDDQGRAKTPPFRQNLFGATFGGPLQKNKHFFFGSYEGFRQRLEATGSPTVPTADLVRLFPGDLGRLSRAFYFDQNVVPQTGYPTGATVRPFPAADRTAAVAAGFSPALFDGELANGEAATAQVSRSSTRDLNQNAFLIRTDHLLRDGLSLSLRYAHADYTIDSSTFGLPGTKVQTPGEYRSPAVQVVWTPNASNTVEIRGAVLRRYMDNIFRDDFTSVLGPLGITEFGVGITATGTAAFTLPGLSPFSIFDAQTTPQIAAQHSWTKGRWTLRSGADLRLIEVNFLNRSFPRPSYTFNGLVGPNGLLGTSPSATDAVASVASVTLFGANGGPTTPLRGWQSQQQEYFAQADWRMRKDLTLNLGLRYTYFGVYQEANNALSNLYAIDPSGRIMQDATAFEFGRTQNEMAAIGPERPFYQPDYNNFQPRLGFAWNVAGRDSTVIRGAFGVYFDRLYQLVISEVSRNVPLAVTGNALNVPFRPSQPIPINPRVPVINTVDPKIRNPRVQRYNISIEQRLGPDTSITAAYVGTLGRDLFMTEDPNFAGAYPQAQRPDPRFSDQRILRNLAYSNYHSLQLYGRRRYSRGLTFTAAYTYSQYKDLTSTDTIFGVLPTVINTGASAAPGFQIGPTTQKSLDSEYGFSENDAPHVFTASYLWDIPFRCTGLAQTLAGNWTLSGLVNARSGNTFDVTLGQDVNDDGAFNDRPALLSGTLDHVRAGSGADKTQWLLPQAQARTFFGAPSNVIDPFASVPRNAYRGPDSITFDASLQKRFLLIERTSLNFEANFFNVFNRANLRPPNSNLSSGFFGQVQATALGSTPRQIQLGLKLRF